MKLEDIQNSVPEEKIPLDKVGIKGFKYPVTVLDREKGLQHTVAEINLYVDLPAKFKGTHMSRFIEVINESSEWRREADTTLSPSLTFINLEPLFVCEIFMSLILERFIIPFFVENIISHSLLKSSVIAVDIILPNESNDTNLEICSPPSLHFDSANL